MKVYMYRAALYCEACGQAIREQLDKDDKRPEQHTDETTYDSDDYPKGPYKDGGGKADCFQHCDACHVFLANPLTEDGIQYTLTALAEYMSNGRGRTEVLDAWAQELLKYFQWMKRSDFDKVGKYLNFRKK